MNFEDALNSMQEGHKVRLPGWGGYWRWCDSLNTIIIHNKDGSILDIRETKEVDFTLRNMLKDTWELFELPEELKKEVKVEQPFWWDEVDFKPHEPRVLRRGDRDPAGESDGPIHELQRELNRVGASLTIDGVFGPATERAVINFQRRVGLVADGIFGDKTAAAIDGHPFPGTLEQHDLEWAAKTLGCDVAAIMAVSEVESRGRGFFGSGRPAILFERHWMRRRLNHYGIDYRQWMRKHPDIVNNRTGGYKGGEAEHTRLEKAIAIHRPSALESASWGAYQIMGFHWDALGYKSADHYVEEMYKGERQHLEAFVRFIQIDNVLLTAIRSHDWTAFARRYNGPAFAKNRYDVKMAEAHQRYA